jgi:phosphonate transport system substrate-binding protein
MKRRNALFGLAALVALAGAAGLSACDQFGPGASGAGKEINFSILSTENAQSQDTLWKPFLDDMRKQTGLKIKPFFASNYTSLIEAMRFNQVQMGWFSNLSGLEAVRRGGGEVFAHSTDPSGVDGYYSVVIVGANSGLTLDSLLKCDKRLTFGMGDAKSTSGTLAPMAYLFTPKNVDPQTCFKTVRSANHQSNLLSVATGVLDAATNNSTALMFLKRNRPEMAAKIKVIWTSPALPEDPIVWRKDMDPATKEKLRSFFLSYGTAPGAEGERQRANLKALNFGVFKPADDSFLLPVREMEASEELRVAQNSHDALAIKTAQAKLAKIQTEKAAAGAEGAVPAPASAAPAPAKKK